jgi:hypothetical protein
VRITIGFEPLEAARGGDGRFVRSNNTTVVNPPIYRYRNHRRELVKIDKRGRLSQRIVELVKLFEAELGPGVTPMQKLRGQQGASLMAIAEQARGRFMRGEGETLNDVVRCERAALLALRELGIAVAGATHQPDTGLAEYLEAGECVLSPYHKGRVSRYAADRAGMPITEMVNQLLIGYLSQSTRLQ